MNKKFKLVKPERLLLIILAIVIVILVAQQCSMRRPVSSVYHNNSESSETVPEGITIQTITEDGDGSTGTIRQVPATTIDAIGTQMAAYLSAMLSTNLENVRADIYNLLYVEGDLPPDYDPDQYRYVIAIDPAHGGKDKGVVVGDAIEADITLAVARSMVEYLNENSSDEFYFFLTRDMDTTTTDAKRLNRIDAFDADIIITLHCNESEQELGGTLATYQPLHKEDENGNNIWKPRNTLCEKLGDAMMKASARGFGMWYREMLYEEMLILKREQISVCVYMGYLTYFLDNELARDANGQEQAGIEMGKALLSWLDTYAPDSTKGERKAEAEEAAAESNK